MRIVMKIMSKEASQVAKVNVMLIREKQEADNDMSNGEKVAGGSSMRYRTIPVYGGDWTGD